VDVPAALMLRVVAYQPVGNEVPAEGAAGGRAYGLAQAMFVLGPCTHCEGHMRKADRTPVVDIANMADGHMPLGLQESEAEKARANANGLHRQAQQTDLDLAWDIV